jgi:hypothetical protein
MARADYKFTSKRAKIQMRRIQRALAGGEWLSSDQLGARICLDPSMVVRYLAHMRQAPRSVFIADWPLVGQVRTPVYALGDSDDAPRRRKTNKEKWDEVRSDPARYAGILEHRAKAKVTRIRPAKTDIKRDRRHYDPPLPQQVSDFVAEHPGYTTAMIVGALGANERAVKYALTMLRADADIAISGKVGAAPRWESLRKPPVKHAPTVTRPQDIFAALGL